MCLATRSTSLRARVSRRRARSPRKRLVAMLMSDPRTFRSALGQFATGVTVVTTMTPDGPVGLTVNSFASVSLDPPLVLWSLRTQSYHHAVFAGCEHFGVNVLAEDQEQLSRHFATPLIDKFAGVAWRRGVGGVPVLDGAAATFECGRQANHSGGDHTIFLGRVEHFAHRDHVLPLVFCRGNYIRRSFETAVEILERQSQ